MSSLQKGIALLALGMAPWPCQAVNLPTCTLSSVSVEFGTYIPAGGNADSVGSLTFRMTGSSNPIAIRLGAGNSNSFSPRSMTGQIGQLAYNLYLDAARTSVWGDGGGGSSYYQNGGPPTDTDVRVPVYGRIPGGQSVAPGTYSDTILISLDY
jgi:spore coat protein U-like protein